MNFDLKDCVVGLNSPFPWAPGHAYIELENLIYKKRISGDPRVHLYPWPHSPVSQALINSFQSSLVAENIFIISEPRHVHDALVTSEHIDISLSSIKYKRRDDISLFHYRNDYSADIYTELVSKSAAPLTKYLSSNQAMQTDYQDYSENYIKYNDHVTTIFKSLKQKNYGGGSKSLGFLNSGNPLVVINIREHCANGSSGHSISQFEPVVSYLLDKNYTIVDISHENKSTEVLEFCQRYQILPYWNLPEKSALNDIEIMSKASFYIGAGGISHLALLLRVPTLWIGSLYPIQIPSEFGFQIPCHLLNKKRNFTLSLEELFNIGCNRPELWDLKYDSWLKKYGPYNMHNCIDELESTYQIFKPSSHSILKGFIELENICLDKKNFHSSINSKRKDLLNRSMIYLGTPYSWNGE